MHMLQRLKRTVDNSPLQPIARRIASLAFPRAWVAYAEPRDNAQMQAVIQRVLREDSNCVDVGCHKGAVLESIIGRAPRGQHIAIEPIPELAATLRERFPNVTVFEGAVSDYKGTAQFQHVVDAPAYSGLNNRSFSEGFRTRPIQVEVTRLDELLPQDQNFDLLKVDVEGADLAVFRGGRSTLERCRPVILFERGDNPEAVYDLLVGELGLTIYRMGDWLAGKRGISRHRFCSTRWTWNFLAC